MGISILSIIQTVTGKGVLTGPSCEIMWLSCCQNNHIKIVNIVSSFKCKSNGVEEETPTQGPSRGWIKGLIWMAVTPDVTLSVRWYVRDTRRKHLTKPGGLILPIFNNRRIANTSWGRKEMHQMSFNQFGRICPRYIPLQCRADQSFLQSVWKFTLGKTLPERSSISLLIPKIEHLSIDILKLLT